MSRRRAFLSALAPLVLAACRLDFTDPAEPPAVLEVELAVLQTDSGLVRLRALLPHEFASWPMVDPRIRFDGVEIEPEEQSSGALLWEDLRRRMLPLLDPMDGLTFRLEGMPSRIALDLPTGPRIALADDDLGDGEDLVLTVDLGRLGITPLDSVQWTIAVLDLGRSVQSFWRVSGLPPPEVRVSRTLLGRPGERSVGLHLDARLAPFEDDLRALRVERRLFYDFGASIVVR